MTHALGQLDQRLPDRFFLVVPRAGFAPGAGFGSLAFRRELAVLRSAFSLFAAAS